MGILSNYRVLDFGRYIAGPYCGALLADYGADVIRIEKVDGSEDRFTMPVDESGVGAMFLQMNRGKRGLTLNPTKPEGKEVLKRLVESADVVVANMPDSGLEAAGLDYASLCKIKPNIILTKTSTFGSEGPYANRVGFDALGQTMSGAAYLAGDTDQPSKFIAPYVDFSTAMMSALGTVMALMHRNQTGEGQIVEGALFGTALSIMSAYLAEQDLAKLDRTGTQSRSQVSGPSDLIRTKDGWIFAQVIGDPLFKRWANMIGRPELIDDPKFQSDELRGINGAELTSFAESHARTHTTDELLEIYDNARVPAGPLLSPEQVLRHEQTIEGNFLETVNYPEIDAPVPVAKAPIRLSKQPGEITAAAPTLGQNTPEILSELGFSEEEINTFKAVKAV